MVKVIGFVSLTAGGSMLVIGSMGLYGTMYTRLNPWAFIILGIFLFWAGIYILKHRKE